MFTSKKSLEKIENIKKRALCFVRNDYQSNCYDLLNKSEAAGIKIMTLRLLAIKVYKRFDNFNPEYLNEVFPMKNCPYDLRDTFILEYTPQSTALSLLEIMVPKYGIFYQTNVNQLYLKNMISSWNGPRCKCSVCSIFLNWSYSVKHDTVYFTVCKLMFYACFIILPLY